MARDDDEEDLPPSRPMGGPTGYWQWQPVNWQDLAILFIWLIFFRFIWLIFFRFFWWETGFFKGLKYGHLQNLGRPLLLGTRSSSNGGTSNGNGGPMTLGLPQRPRPMTLWEVAMMGQWQLMGQWQWHLTRHHQDQWMGILDLQPVQGQQVLPASFVWTV